MREVYGYTRRPGQSRDLVTVPFALIQEAEAGCPGGDTKTLLRAILLHEPMSPGDWDRLIGQPLIQIAMNDLGVELVFENRDRLTIRVRPTIELDFERGQS